MLDIHPAHHAATTWRDFFIHIATICVGLLIAVALASGSIVGLALAHAIHRGEATVAPLIHRVIHRLDRFAF